jgi:hypothetical protein
MTHDYYSKSMPSNRSFGLVFFVFFLIVSFLLFFHGIVFWYWFFYLSITFLILAFSFPKVLLPLNRFWTLFGLFIQKFTSPILLTIIFFLIITPTGLLMRLFGKHYFQLKWKFDPNVKSYWISRKLPNRSDDTFKNQF